MRIFIWTTLFVGMLFVILSICIALPIMTGFIFPNQRLKQPTKRISYIPVVRDDHQVDLIHDRDTIKIYLENAYALQEEYVVFVEQ